MAPREVAGSLFGCDGCCLYDHDMVTNKLGVMFIVVQYKFRALLSDNVTTVYSYCCSMLEAPLWSLLNYQLPLTLQQDVYYFFCLLMHMKSDGVLLGLWRCQGRWRCVCTRVGEG